MLQAATNLLQLAESDARREEAQHRERHHAALIRRLSCAASVKIGLVSVHLCDGGHRASLTSPRLKRGMTFGVGQRSANSSALTTACTADSTQGGALQWVHVPRGNCASPSPPSHEAGVALLVARTTCNEVVPAHKEFLRTRQTPIRTSDQSIVCWVLACTAVSYTHLTLPTKA